MVLAHLSITISPDHLHYKTPVTKQREIRASDPTHFLMWCLLETTQTYKIKGTDLERFGRGSSSQHYQNNFLSMAIYIHKTKQSIFPF